MMKKNKNIIKVKKKINKFKYYFFKNKMNKSILSEFLKNNFKKRFVINLDRRKDRYNGFLNRIPFDSDVCERFSAVDGKNIKEFKNNDNPFVIGCHLSHKSILKLVVEDETIKDDDIILIFEDDVFFSDSFSEEINKLVNYLKNLKKMNYLVYIGGRFTHKFQPSCSKAWKAWNKIIDNIYLKNTSYYSYNDCDRTTNVLILSKYTCKQILDKTKNVSTSIPIDTLYNGIKKYIPDIEIYDVFPHICYSPINYMTDIQNYKT